MTTKPRYLTKSRYKLALECPTKLFYTGKRDTYFDASVDDPFLAALARGGFQVGALAQCYYDGGVEVTAKGHDEALAETARLLERESVTIFEAAIRFENLFVRVDVLEKKGNRLRLLEVKAKSFDRNEEDPFFDKRAYAKGKIKIKSGYKSYLYDVAFQTHVVRSALPSLELSSFLVLADKSVVASVDGLNQFFLLREVDGRSVVEVSPSLDKTELGTRVLCEVNVDEAVNAILSDKDEGRPATDRYQGLSFKDEVTAFARKYAADEKIAVAPGKHCRDCAFRGAVPSPLKSGFGECWTSEAKVPSTALHDPFVFDIWNFRRAEALIEDKKYFVKDVSIDDIAPKPNKDEPGLSQSERQWLQVEFVQKGRTRPHVDVDGLRAAMSAWKFPLHFIDFETAMVAIPFNAGRRPYEQLAFQFSHHIVHQDGRIEHADQYLDHRRGVFPNFDFVRALRKSLSGDDGSIFRYAVHENTVLCQIFEQLKASSEPDRAELMAWIQTITRSGSTTSETWLGMRNMIDLWELVKRFYYHPATGGSVSIKKVLPAILSDSPELQERFSKPIYGSAAGVKSLNFERWAWIQCDDERLRDPYELLPKVYRNLDPSQLDRVMCDDELADGGAAMTAYAMMQFTQMADSERDALRAALLKYCELDTFAMVLLYEYWREYVDGKRLPAAA